MPKMFLTPIAKITAKKNPLTHLVKKENCLFLVEDENGKVQVLFGTVFELENKDKDAKNRVFAGYKVPKKGLKLEAEVFSCETDTPNQELEYSNWEHAADYTGMEAQMQEYPALTTACSYPSIYGRHIASEKGGYCPHIAHLAAVLQEDKNKAFFKNMKIAFQSLMSGCESSCGERSELANSIALAFGEYYRGGCVLLTGPAGSGKTHVAYTDVPQHIEEQFPGVKVVTEIVPCGDPKRFTLRGAIYTQDFSINGTGEIVYKVGSFGKAIQAAIKGDKAVIVLDEFLNLPRELQTDLNTFLSPLSERNEKGRVSKYFLMPWIPQLDLEGRLAETYVKVPVKNLFVIATGNIGENFFNEIDPSINSRFVRIQVDKNAELMMLAIKKTLNGYDLPTNIESSFKSLLQEYLEAISNDLTDCSTPDIRQITSRMETAIDQMMGEWEDDHADESFKKWFESKEMAFQKSVIKNWNHTLGQQLLVITENVANPNGETTEKGEISNVASSYKELVKKLFTK